MGKKHKKHHRHDDDDDDGSSNDGERSQAPSAGSEGPSGLKLILKVGSGSSKHHGEKHKKKKKKKDKKHKHHHKDKIRHAAEALIRNPVKDEVILMSPRLADPVSHVPVVRPHVELSQPHLDLARSPISNVIIPRLLPEPSVVKLDPSPPFVASAAPPPPPPPAPTAAEPAPLPSSSALPTLEPQPTTSKPINEASRRALFKLLEHFLHHLQKKDVNQFFALPVDDQFAPGYSEIIKEPMDFSTMRMKLGSGKYFSLPAFKSDFELVTRLFFVYGIVVVL